MRKSEVEEEGKCMSEDGGCYGEESGDGGSAVNLVSSIDNEATEAAELDELTGDGYF